MRGSAQPGVRALSARRPHTLLLGGHTWRAQTGDAGEAPEPGDMTGTTAPAPKCARWPNVTLESPLGVWSHARLMGSCETLRLGETICLATGPRDSWSLTQRFYFSDSGLGKSSEEHAKTAHGGALHSRVADGQNASDDACVSVGWGKVGIPPLRSMLSVSN